MVRAFDDPAAWLAPPVITNLLAAPPLTVTLNGVSVVIPVAVAGIEGVSALYSTIEPPALETPLLKVIVVAVPKFTAVPLLLLTVGI